jgi:hypothetical protein
MTICEEIAADAVGLVASPPDAPERARAEAHAREHAPCAAALAEARRVLALLDATPGPPPPTPEALQRAAAPILADLEAGAMRPARRSRRIAVATGGAAVAAWALPVALARHPVSGGRAFGTSVALAALAALAAAATISAGGFVAAAFPLFSAAFSLMTGENGALEAGLGVHCALIEVGSGAGAVVLAWLATRKAATPDDRPSLIVAAAGGGALAAQAALHVTCEASFDMPHLIVFHTGAVLLVMGLALLAAYVLFARPRLAKS